ncbi:hypothetical protein BST61_g1142 [Cercospora zeina]
MKGKTVLVTGGGRGIGFAVCKAVAQMGGNVEKPVDEFSELSKKFGSTAVYQQADVTKQDSLEAAFSSVVDSLGEIHGCVPAAGIAIDKPFFEHQWEECQRVLAVNTLGTFWTTKLVSQHMSEHGKGGSIVMIASIAAQGFKIPLQNISIYNMSKAAVKGLAGPLAVEMGPHKIRVNTISPGIILSPMTIALKTQYPKLLNMFEHAAPADRIGVPEDLTPAIIYLLSDAASFTTGTDIVISGGIHAGTSMAWTERSMG